MKNLLLIILTLTCFSAFAQNKIVLKDQSYIKDAEYRNVKNSIIEYLQNGSLHDIEVEKVLWIEKADGSHLYFDEKGNSYVKTAPVNDPSQKTIVHTETDKNKAYFDSTALDEEKRALRKAAYEKELENMYAKTTPNKSVVYDSVVTGGSIPDNKMPERVNTGSREKRREYLANQESIENAALEYYSDRSPEYRQGYVDGKLYRSKVSKYDIPNPMDVSKLPIPEKYMNSAVYKSGFIHGIRAKQKQRTAAVVLPAVGIAIIATFLVIAAAFSTTHAGIFPAN